MIIGITNNDSLSKINICSFFQKKYNFRYIDVDKIVENILKEQFYLSEFNFNWKNYTSLLLNIRHKIDKYINIIAEKYKDEIIVLDYTLLEDTYIFNNCDVIIKNISNNNTKNNNEIEMLKNFRKSTIESKYDNSKYHLELDMNGKWENKLEDYINFNLLNTTKVTVVVPVYNTSAYLPRCVNSIINQTYRNLEIILINDGSTDESLKVCKFLADRDDRIKVINQNNVGLSETRNKGIELATGEYISFIDSDDYIENRMIEVLLKTAKKYNADVCESSFYIHMKDGTIKDVSCEQKGVKFVNGKLDLINSYSNATILIPAWDKLYKLSAIKDIKFDKNCFKEDSDYIYRLCLAEKTFALVNIPFYHYIKRKSVSLTGNKISDRLFTLQDWGKKAYQNTLKLGEEYKDAAEKILYNSLVHILRNYMRDYKSNILKENEFKDEIQSVVNDIISLLLKAKNVKKFRKLDEVLSIINELKDNNVIEKEKMPSIELPCIGILWNSLSEEMINEAINFIGEKAKINECISVDLKDKYREFINEIYLYNNEFEGIPVIKAGTLIDRYDSNTIIILNLIVKISNYIYFNKLKGFMFEEIAELKTFIRKYFKYKIKDYAYDNIFHLTVDDEEYKYTDEICKKYIKDYRGNKNDKK